jgi:hypothetical protein
MIVRQISEMPPNKYGTTVFIGTLSIFIQRKKEVEEYSKSVLKPTHKAALDALNEHLLKVMKTKVDMYTNQREQALAHSQCLAQEHVNALYHIRATTLKTTNLLEFSRSYVKNWNYVQALLPSEDSKVASWRTIMKQFFHTCSREIGTEVVNF